MKMRVLADADLIFELCMKRDGRAEEAQKLIEMANRQAIEVYVTDSCLAKICFYVGKPIPQRGEEFVSHLRDWLNNRIIMIERRHIDRARTLPLKDPESGIEAACAIDLNIPAIVTQHPENFSNAGLNVLSVSDLSELLRLEENLEESNLPVPEPRPDNYSTNEVDTSSDFDLQDRECQLIVEELPNNINMFESVASSTVPPPCQQSNRLGELSRRYSNIILFALLIVSPIILQKLQYNTSSSLLRSSFQDSCDEISMNEDKLSANCRKFDGSYTKTSISVPGLQNRDGNLIFEGFNNSSNFQDSCDDISITGDKLSANCRKFDGSYTKTSISVPGLQNRDGELALLLNLNNM